MEEQESEPLGYLLKQVAAMLRPQMTTELGPLGLGLPDFVCLRILSLHPGCTSAELARHTHVSAQAMNQLLRRLESIGAVTRPPTATTGRALPAELTPAGKKLLARAERAAHGADQRVLERLTPTEQHQLRRLLHKVTLRDTPEVCGRTVPFES